HYSLTRSCRRGGAQVEAGIGGLLGGQLAAGSEKAARVGMVGRAVDRLDAEQRPALVAEDGEFAAPDIAARHGLIMPVGEAGDLQPELALLAPEPRQCAIGMRLADDPVGDAAGVVGGVLHGFEAGWPALGMLAREC